VVVLVSPITLVRNRTDYKQATKYGYILYPGFAALDVFGPLEALAELSMITPDLNLTIIAETLDPVPSVKVPSGQTQRTLQFGNMLFQLILLRPLLQLMY
jgi:hypothetical protein